jgi:hypothetical protein
VGELAEGTVHLLNYLLPGFLTAWIFYSLTPFRINNQFERIIQALIFTVIIKSSYFLVEWLLLIIGKAYSFGQIYSNTGEIISFVLAVIYGLLFSYISNNDYIHRISRHFGVSQEHSYISEWFNAFKSNPDKYIIIKTKIDSTFEGRRIYGYPDEFPPQHSEGHFNISDPSWIGEKSETIEGEEQMVSVLFAMTGVTNILIPSEDVAWIEFIKSAESLSPSNES